MHPLTHPRPGPTPARPRTAPGALAALWHDLAASWRRARASARQEAIDDTTLRDLGLARCELESFHAEAQGLVAHTRLRVTPRAPGAQ